MTSLKHVCGDRLTDDEKTKIALQYIMYYISFHAKHNITGYMQFKKITFYKTCLTHYEKSIVFYIMKDEIFK